MLKTRILETEWLEWKLCIKDYNTPKTIGPKCHKIITGKEIFFTSSIMIMINTCTL